MTPLTAGQSLQLNNRLWTLRQVRPRRGRCLTLEAIGASEAAQGMTRTMQAYQWGNELFIEQRRGGFMQANLHNDWLDGVYGPVLNFQPATALNLLDAHTRHPALGDLPNTFSWSYSRAALYQSCPRAYYYHYYASWEGWQADAPPPVRKAYLLKNLTDLSRWRGALVHETIKFAMARLKTGHPVNTPDLIAQMRRRAQTDIQNSRSGRYRQDPAKLTGFQEHYYRLKLPASAWPATLAEAEQHVEAFTTSPLYAHLRDQPPATFLNVETLQEFELAGVKIWLQMDLARRENGVIYLYDWKTGPVNEVEARRQLGVYGLFARHVWQAAAITGVVFALADNQVTEIELDAGGLQVARTEIETSMNTLQNLLINPQTNQAELRRFPMIDDLQVCKTCRFRELCGRDH